nr:reverse transcriptase domain-containing protein [Tanacetum cinerariifolium]
MSTRSSARNLFPPLDNPELTIRRRSHADPTLLNDFEMAAEGNGDLPVPDLRTMEELCQPSLNGREHQSGVTDDALRLYLFPHSLTHHATAWFDRLPRNSINTFEQMAKMFLGKYFPPSMVAKLRNEITNFHQRLDESDWDTSSITSSSDTEIAALKAEMTEINKNLMRVLQVNKQVKAVTPNCETCGGRYSFNDCPTTAGQTQNEDLKGITTRSGIAYQAPTIRTTSSSLPPVVEREINATKDTVHPTNNGSTKEVQPLVVQTKSPILNFEPVVAPIIEPVDAPFSAPRPNQRLSIPYPSRLRDQKLREKANDQREKFF